MRDFIDANEFEHIGPEYPKLGATVQKFRRLASGGFASLTREQRRAYGEAVEREILALQRAALARAAPAPGNPWPSGTASPDGAAIHRAVQSRQQRELLAYPDKVRRKRKPEAWGEMYCAAMIARHGCKWFEANQERLLKDWDSRAYEGL